SRGSNGVSMMPSATVPSSATLSEAGTLSVGASGFTVSATLVVLETKSVGSAPKLFFAVIVRFADTASPASRVRPLATCVELNVIGPPPPKLSPSPSFRTAAPGRPEIVVKTKMLLGMFMLRGSATVPSSPTLNEAGAEMVGTIGSTVTDNCSVVLAKPPAVLLAVMVNGIGARSLTPNTTGPAVSDTPVSNCASVIVAKPVKVCPLPSVSVSSGSSPEIETVTGSLGSNGVMLTGSATVPSCRTEMLEGEAVTVGATGVTSRNTFCLVEAVAPASLVALTVRLVATGSPASSVSPLLICARPSVIGAPPLKASPRPSVSVSSDGIPLIVTSIGSPGLNGVTVIGTTTVPSSFVVSEDGAESPGATGSTAPVPALVTVALCGLSGSRVLATTRMEEPTSDSCTA